MGTGDDFHVTHLIQSERVFAPQAEHGIERLVGAETARILFNIYADRIDIQRLLAQAVQYFGQAFALRVQCLISALPIDSVRRGRESGARQQRRANRGRSAMAGLKRLGHGAKILAAARRLRNGDAQRMRDLRFVQPEQHATRYGRTEHAQCGR